MTRFRVITKTESQYIDVIDADDAGSAAKVLGDKIRAGTIKPTVGPAISDVRVTRYEQGER